MLTWIVILMALLGGCSIWGDSGMNEASPQIVFSATQAEQQGELRWWVDNGAAQGFWTPTPAQIDALEGALPAYLESQGANRFYGEPLWENLSRYQRQYAGLQINGAEVIYANFFCDSVGQDPRQTWITVDDGGACFFTFQYDVTTGQFSMLQVNGVA